MSETLGSAAEEAAKLIAAVQEWARTRFDSEHLATGSAECQVKPETIEHLLDAAASVVAALRSTVGHHPEPSGTGRVQHIDIREG
jgi:hypothetical protein